MKRGHLHRIMLICGRQDNYLLYLRVLATGLNQLVPPSGRARAHFVVILAQG
jgi:hypothetical protein